MTINTQRIDVMLAERGLTKAALAERDFPAKRQHHPPPGHGGAENHRQAGGGPGRPRHGHHQGGLST